MTKQSVQMLSVVPTQNRSCLSHRYFLNFTVYILPAQGISPASFIHSQQGNCWTASQQEMSIKPLLGFAYSLKLLPTYLKLFDIASDAATRISWPKYQWGQKDPIRDHGARWQRACVRGKSRGQWSVQWTACSAFQCLWQPGPCTLRIWDQLWLQPDLLAAEGKSFPSMTAMERWSIKADWFRLCLLGHGYRLSKTFYPKVTNIFSKTRRPILHIYYVWKLSLMRRSLSWHLQAPTCWTAGQWPYQSNSNTWTRNCSCVFCKITVFFQQVWCAWNWQTYRRYAVFGYVVSGQTLLQVTLYFTNSHNALRRGQT